MAPETKKFALIIFALLIGLAGLTTYGYYVKSHPTLTVITDKTPLSLSIGGKQIELSNSESRIRLQRGEYYYYTTQTIDGNQIKLIGKVNSSQKPFVLNLNFGSYSKSSVIKTLCSGIIDSANECPYLDTVKKISFLGDYEWAIVVLDIPGPETENSYAALHHNESGWEIAVQPTASIADFNGIVPAEILGGYMQ